MEELARRFCREAGERSGLRYSQELRRVAMEYARATEKSGKGGRDIAETLGLSEATLSHRGSGEHLERVSGLAEDLDPVGALEGEREDGEVPALPAGGAQSG